MGRHVCDPPSIIGHKSPQLISLPFLGGSSHFFHCWKKICMLVFAICFIQNTVEFFLVLFLVEGSHLCIFCTCTPVHTHTCVQEHAHTQTHTHINILSEMLFMAMQRPDKTMLFLQVLVWAGKDCLEKMEEEVLCTCPGTAFFNAQITVLWWCLWQISCVRHHVNFWPLLPRMHRHSLHSDLVEFWNQKVSDGKNVLWVELILLDVFYSSLLQKWNSNQPVHKLLIVLHFVLDKLIFHFVF